MSKTFVIGVAVAVLFTRAASVTAQEENVAAGAYLQLRENWRLRSSSQTKEEGDVISTTGFAPDGWQPTQVPSTVLNAMVKNGVYPDPRVGLNNFLIPDASDEFNGQHDLAKYSHLPDKRNPWKDPYWFRVQFELPRAAAGKQVWLNFQGINYRADVWLNGNRVADGEAVVGALSRYRLNVTEHARPAEENCLAVKVRPVDHPGTPNAQLDVFGKVREYRKQITNDATLIMSIGYDCMPTVRDRNMGLWQEVYVDWTGPVDIRNPFVVTDLPLPQTSPASLTVSAELVNTTRVRQKGILRGAIAEDGTSFEKVVELGPGETKNVVFSGKEFPQLVMANPRLWWPHNYGEQHLYHLTLSFQAGGKVSDEEKVTFGVREITKVLHELDGEHGLRLHINGKKVFCRGGYIQPEVMFDGDAKRSETEVRYLTEANLNLVYFEDIPNPPEHFTRACDKYGLMWGNCYYGCWRNEWPDVDLLSRGTIDVVKRYRNHPSSILHMAQNEGDTPKDVYEMWRKHVIELDGTRFLVPSGSYPNFRKNPPEWVRKDMPVGMNDWVRGKSYGWQEPSQYYRWVRHERAWMFQMECGSASLPPIDSLRRFLPDLWETPEGPHFPLSKTWAHHGANSYYRPYDSALRRMHGSPRSVEDYCMKGHLVTADQHRAMFEATRHRMWDITSGLTQWKVNACWPSIQWQIYDWYLKPMVSYYYIKKACEPLHVQLSPPDLDQTVTVVNDRFQAADNLAVGTRVYDFNMELRWEKNVRTRVEANSYKEIFAVPDLADLAPVYFVKLELKDAQGKLLSDNFYWFSSKRPADFTRLAELPLVKLNVSCDVEQQGETCLVHTKVENPTDKLAFFIHLAATRGPHGEEVLPVFWEDNYFSLLPGESKVVRARLAAKDVGQAPLALEVGGWNVQTKFDCTDLKLSKTEVPANQRVSVVATIENTFLDGSRIELCVDNEVVDSTFLWARGDVRRQAAFELKLSKPGSHQIKVGDRTVVLLVK